MLVRCVRGGTVGARALLYFCTEKEAAGFLRRRSLRSTTDFRNVLGKKHPGRGRSIFQAIAAVFAQVWAAGIIQGGK